MTFASHMDRALEAAKAAASRGEVPVGAVVVEPKTGAILACEGNRTRELLDVTAHAELLALKAAAKTQGSERLTGLDLYVTLEPCPMCAAAISAFRIRRLYYGASDPKSGGVEQGPCIFSHPQAHHTPEVYAGMGEAAASQLLKSFFATRR